MIELFIVAFWSIIIYALIHKVHEAFKNEDKKNRIVQMQEERNERLKEEFAFHEKNSREKEAKKRRVNIMF